MSLRWGTPLCYVNGWNDVVTLINEINRKKLTRPGGTTGRVRYDTGVDEAPVPDAGIHNQSIFERSMPSDLIRGWVPGSREENASNINPHQ
jgi:hypothetical protein